MNYSNKNGSFYNGDCANGDREATPEEIAAWELSRLPTVQDQLNSLDTANALTQRNLRETVMLMAEAFKTISGGALDLSTLPGVAKVYAVEAEAAALRGQL